MSESTVDTHVVGEGADAITYDVRGDLADADAGPPGADDHRLADGRVGLRHPRGPLHRPPRRHLRPARRRSQPDRHHAGAARAARRGRPPGDRGARRGPGGSVREQRWRRQRARAGGRPPRRRASARRARAAHGRVGARPRHRGGGVPGHGGDLPARGLRARDGQVHRAGDVRRRAARGLPRPARARPRHVRHVGRGRRQPHRPADAQHAVLPALRARRGGAARDG